MNDYSVLPSVTELDDDDATPILTDAAPNTPTDGECQVCSKPIAYAGRGRRPKFCPEHTGNKRKTPAARGNATNQKMAEQAADVLGQYNDLLTAGLMIGSMPVTAARLAAQNQLFKTQALNALSTDPALCRSILSAGGASARVSLAFAYALLAASIAPAAIAEVKTLRARRAESDDGE